MASSCDTLDWLEEGARPAPDERHAAKRDAGVVRLGWTVLALSVALAAPGILDGLNQLADSVLGSTWEFLAWSSLLQQAFPPSVLASLWPIALAVAMIALGWPELLMAAWVCMGVAGVGELAAVSFIGLGYVDFDAYWAMSAHDLARLGLVFHIACFGCAIWVRGAIWQAYKLDRISQRSVRQHTSRPSAIIGRLAVVGSLLFGLFVLCSIAWVMYERYALRIDPLRKFLATQEETPDPRFQGLMSGQDPALVELDEAAVLARQGHYREARDLYVRALQTLEDMARQANRPNLHRDRRARGFNNLAWMLATCSDSRVRAPEKAVVFARRSLELVSQDGNTWNTLGVALYRASELDEAKTALEKGMSLRDGGDAIDWFFLAMIEYRLGDKVAAVDWHQKAAERRETTDSRDEELRGFHAESAELLGQAPPRPLPPAPEPPPARARRLRNSR